MSFSPSPAFPTTTFTILTGSAHICRIQAEQLRKTRPPTASVKPNRMARTMASPKTKKAVATNAGAKKKKSAAATTPSTSSHKPTYLDMIREAVGKQAESGDKTGISRQKIKSFMEEKYGIDAEAPTSKTAFKRALEKGVESGELILPNGISGKIKMASKAALKKLYAEQEQSESEEESSGQENQKPKKGKASSSNSKSSASSGKSTAKAKPGAVQKASKKRS